MSISWDFLLAQMSENNLHHAFCVTPTPDPLHVSLGRIAKVLRLFSGGWPSPGDRAGGTVYPLALESRRGAWSVRPSRLS